MGKPAVFTLSDMKNELASALRRTSVSPTIHGYRPQAHQIPFHSSPKVGRLFLGGNRAGKTVAGAAEMVMWLTGTHILQDVKFRPPIRARAIGVDFENGVKKIMQPEIARWIPTSFLKNGSWEESYEKSSRTLTLTNGSTLEFMSYDQDKDKFAGTSRHIVWFDEEPPEGIFNENLLRLADVGGHWMLTMTPLIDMSWTIDRLYEPSKDGQNPNIDVFEVNTEQNKYVSSTVMDILMEGLSDEEKAARKAGKYFSYTGAIYGPVLTPDIFVPSLFDPDKPERWDLIRRSWGHFGMLDHGFTNPTAFLLGAFDHEGRVIIYDEYYQSGKIVKDNAAEIKALIGKHGIGHKLEYIIADPSTRNTDPITGSSIQQEYAEHGVYMAMANNDVIAGINRVYSRFKNKQLFITENCEKTKWELLRYRWDKYSSEKTTTKNNVKETPMKKNDHACDALRYGIVSRPALTDEVDIKRGNVLNMPEAISPVGPLIDHEASYGYENENDNFISDPELGDEF
jgi:phage terminase large subunit-like protein